MKKFHHIKSGIIASATLGTLLASTSAFAIPYQSNTVYKATESSQTTVYISGTPNSKVPVSLGSTVKTTAKIAGACGELKISPPASGSFAGLTIDGVSVNASSLSTETLPSCVNGSFAEARTSNFKTPNGQLIIVGKTPGSAVSVGLPTESSRSISINACGFGALRASSGQSLPATFTIASTSYTLATLPDSSKGPFCRSNGGISTGYVPASW